MANINAPRAFAAGTATVADTAIDLADFTGLTDALVAQAGRVVVAVNTNSVHVRYDGAAPTAAVGILLVEGEKWVLDNAANIRRLQLIRDTGNSATVFVTLEK